MGNGGGYVNGGCLGGRNDGQFAALDFNGGDPPTKK
jgi:hypothetical protein